MSAEDIAYATYVYAVARDGDALRESAAESAGVAGAPVRIIPGTGDGAPVFVASSVSAHDFDEAALRRHLEDLEWLEAVARAHHAVIERLGAATTVLPLRLATVYLDDDRAREALDAGRAAFEQLLAKLEGHVEWGIKIYVEAPDEAAPPPPPGPASSPGVGPGRAYLSNRRAQRSVRDSAHRAAGTAAERIEAAGRAFATDRARHRVQQGELAGSRDENVVNDAYLLRADRSDAFRAEVARAADDLPGVRVDVTGPWVPYSFATAPEPAAAEGGPS
ncbi:GvpL/GvpF family gas vesicle protein [Streptomyces xantholiticus]|uniref:GvpL/GvpF family gas vesicle protein n=1 Tax=Streptomyces xantholiticus TaxID=68285 RepID=UPI001674B429|nr:GvpL/GvpF family gas vesicle protein [Streptomyces xantholiticus]GGW26448.1 gas vesicle protein [Streptomyces xantholiticus]